MWLPADGLTPDLTNLHAYTDALLILARSTSVHVLYRHRSFRRVDSHARRHQTNRVHLQQQGTMRHHSSTPKQVDSSEQKGPSETLTAIQSQVFHNRPENKEICASMRKQTVREPTCWTKMMSSVNPQNVTLLANVFHTWKCWACPWRGWTLTILPCLPPPMKTTLD